jgi:hypothetical protein
MKRFLASLSTISLIEVIGRHPAMAAGILSLLGVGGGAVISGLLTPPTLTPFISSNFNPNQSFGYTNNGLRLNGGTDGSMHLPTNAPDSAAFYGEMVINPNLSGSQGIEVPFNGAELNHNTVPGLPNLFFQRNYLNISNISWWLNPGTTFEVAGSATGGSSYASGFYPFTAPSTGCARPPTGVWQGGGIFQQIDPGFGCPLPASAFSLNAAAIAANIPGSGAQQATGAGSVATTCAVVNGEAVVTAHVAVAHGVTPGIPFPLQGFTPTGYNATYIALPGTTGTTLVGTTGATSCPAAVSAEGTALLGTGGSITFPLASTTNPYTSGSTGITVHNSQHICFWLGENGDNSAFPGSQFLEMVDEKGNAVAGSPALVPYLNQGMSSFIGYMTTSAQPQLTVTALNPSSISGASFNATTGYATFTTSTNPGYIPGSEFTVSGVTSTGPGSFNLTYVAVAGTAGTTIVANPLSGPAGVPQVSSLTGSSAWSSGGSMASVILPGAQIFGASNGTLILPYGTDSSTGTGGVGTYALSGSQNGYTFNVSSVTGSGPWTITVTGSPAQNIIPGTTFTLSSVSSTTFTITALGTGTSGAGTYIATSTGSAPLAGTATASGAIGSSGSPVTIADFSLFYFNQSATNTNLAGLSLSPRTGASVSDFFSLLGSASATLSGQVNYGWGGSLGNFADLQGPLPLQAGGAPNMSDLASICTKQTDITQYAVAKSLNVQSLYRLNDPGIWGDSSIATISGYIDTISGNTGLLHVVGSPIFGALPTSGTGYLSGAGLPLYSATAITPATVAFASAGPYTVTFQSGTAAALGSISAPVKIALGHFKPALPIQSNTMQGYVDTTAGVSTLHVTSLDDGTAHSGFASFTGALSGTAGGPLTTLTTSAATGTIQIGMAVTDGGVNITGSPLLITSGSGSTWTVSGNYYPAISAEAMTGSMTTLVAGEYIQNSAITNPVKIVSLGAGAIGLTGNYELSGPPNAAGTVGSSGSPVVFTGTTITDGGAIAPGPALTIKDQGPAITFPATNVSANTGTLTLSGTYATGTLGGTPSGLQVLVSNSANGPPLAGCTPCNWGALTGKISGGDWSGTIAGIPGGGPYFVSVRAANGTAYATLPNSVKVGWVFALWGQGQADSMQGAQSGINTSFFSNGLWGSSGWASAYSSLDHYLQGPPISSYFVPGWPVSYAGDRFGVVGGSAILSEAVAAFDQELSGAYSVPTAFLSATRDGVGAGIYTLGNAAQTQTIGAGDGSTLTWCSASTFCPSAGVSPAGPLVFGAASLTGGWFSGASISGTTFSAGTRVGGALEPGMVLNTPNAPTLFRCLTVCGSQMAFGTSTWLLSNSLDSGATPTRADPTGGAPWPNLNIQGNGFGSGPSGVYSFAGFGWSLVKAGTFSVSVNGTVVCEDSATFAYNQTGGNCTGATIASSFVNYQTGDYQITFTSGNAPASGASIVASWTNIISPETLASASLTKVQGVDFFGDSTGPQSGADANLFSKAPGGVNGHIYSGEGTDKTYMLNAAGPSNVGYQFGGIGYSQMVSWLYDTKFPNLIPGANPSVSFITTGQWRIEGPSLFSGAGNLAWDGVHDQWTQDIATSSTFSGTVAGSVLTLTTNATGPMWEGEVLGCVMYNATTCPIGPLSGAYITGLRSTSPAGWGVSGSTYNLSVSPGNLTNQPLQNPIYYGGLGAAFYAGTLNDITVQNTGLAGTTGRSPHPWSSFAGGRRATSRWAAMIYGANGGNATDPKVDRVKADATGCDTSAIAAPCFDIGTTYQAVGSGVWTVSGGTGTFTLNSSGIAAHTRPFVVGQVVSCNTCSGAVVITSVSNPPTQSTATGAGQVGQTFTFQTSGGTIAANSSGTITAGCSGTSGIGSNCIDIAISTNVGGTFGTASALDTCGANKLNGNAPNYSPPNGKCQGNGIGEIVRAFRIGTNQLMYGNATALTPGSVFDDGVDIANGAFNQSAAFTCNIVAAKVVQCVKGASFNATTGAFSLGQWAGGSTYISYGDLTVVSGRIGSLLGYVGGQSFPFTAGSGYTNGTTSPTVTCSTLASGGYVPKFDVTVAGGAIVNVVPSANTSGSPGLGIGSTCTVALPPGGSGGAIPTIQVGPVEGQGGIGTYNTDSNTMGMFLYDNSGEPGNPLNSFFTNGQGGYFEPGLPLRPFGLFQGAVVSG